MNRTYRALPGFWDSYDALSAADRRRVDRAWAVFRVDPFATQLRVHVIHSLSSYYGRTIHSAVIGPNLRVIFFIEGDTVYTVDVGTHDLYR